MCRHKIHRARCRQEKDEKKKKLFSSFCLCFWYTLDCWTKNTWVVLSSNPKSTFPWLKHHLIIRGGTGLRVSSSSGFAFSSSSRARPRSEYEISSFAQNPKKKAQTFACIFFHSPPFWQKSLTELTKLRKEFLMCLCFFAKIIDSIAKKIILDVSLFQALEYWSWLIWTLEYKKL